MLATTWPGQASSVANPETRPRSLDGSNPNDPASTPEQAYWLSGSFLEDEGQGRVREAYPDAVYRRLAEVKAKYDPDNVFRYNQNVRPASRVQQNLAA